MNGRTEEDFKEYSGLASRLGRADFSGESRVKDVLRTSLLDKAERRSRRRPRLWALPAAAVFAAALLMVNVRHKPLPEAASGGSYNLVSDGYGDSGRQGLADYMEEGRF